jgi:hypothetical protein
MPAMRFDRGETIEAPRAARNQLLISPFAQTRNPTPIRRIYESPQGFLCGAILLPDGPNAMQQVLRATAPTDLTEKLVQQCPYSLLGRP